ncbi:MAG: hypothetical protein U0269_21620 [Polyangiales bacterium]
MALECSYCGARAPDDATRCPQCLRATGLIAANDAPARAPLSRKQKLVALAVSTLVVGSVAAGIALFKRSRVEGERAVREGTASVASDVAAPFARVDSVTALAGRASDPLARSRAALDALREKLSTQGHSVSTAIDQGLAPSRSIEQLASALASRSARFTSLDLARLLYSALEGSGLSPRFARRANAPRPDAPADPSGALGRYVVLIGEHAIDPLDSQPVSLRDARASPMTAAQVTGAMLVQSALAAMVTGDRAKATTLLARSIELWPEAGLGHAARAIVTRDGLSGGVDESVTRDLATAVAASGDDPGVLLLRARAAVASGDVVLAQTSARQARAKARAWGAAALANVLAFDANAASGAGRCDALIDANESWTDDALTACRALTASGAAPPESTPAAQRLAASATDPMQFALATLALGEVQRVPSSMRQEYAAWVSVGGRPELAHRALEEGDAGR